MSSAEICQDTVIVQPYVGSSRAILSGIIFTLDKQNSELHERIYRALRAYRIRVNVSEITGMMRNLYAACGLILTRQVRRRVQVERRHWSAVQRDGQRETNTEGEREREREREREKGAGIGFGIGVEFKSPVSRIPRIRR